jgi:hypothetical protein
MKFILPPLAILGCVAGVFAEPPAERWKMIAIGLGACAVVVWFSRKLRQVSIDDDTLYVSTYFKNMSVPISAILLVEQTSSVRPPIVTIYLDRDTSIGREIAFMPRGPGSPTLDHPITTELKDMVVRMQREDRLQEQTR